MRTVKITLLVLLCTFSSSVASTFISNLTWAGSETIALTDLFDVFKPNSSLSNDDFQKKISEMKGKKISGQGEIEEIQQTQTGSKISTANNISRREIACVILLPSTTSSAATRTQAGQIIKFEGVIDGFMLGSLIISQARLVTPEPKIINSIHKESPTTPAETTSSSNKSQNNFLNQTSSFLSPNEVISEFYQACNNKEVDRALNFLVPELRNYGRKKMIENIVDFKVLDSRILSQFDNNCRLWFKAYGQSIGEPYKEWEVTIEMRKVDGEWKMSTWYPRQTR
ncbi:MAG: hypothetical protein HQK55_02340 [Deltaproteobacteria bacterium]|nr:hypothetical protein [Deltaproteobacteria bacterium]